MNSIRNRVYAGEIAGGADTVEYVIVAIVAGRVVNGLVNALIFARGSYSMAFGNQMRNQMDETGKSITNWFTSARNAANTSAGAINSGSNPGK